MPPATRPAMRCCARLRTCCGRRCLRTRRSRDLAPMSSRCYCSTWILSGRRPLPARCLKRSGAAGWRSTALPSASPRASGLRRSGSAARAALRLNWGRRIRDALEQERFELHWQPIVDLASGRPSHGELLLRMREADRVIEPAEFLSAAEQLGLIHAIDRWALARAVALLATGTGPAALPLSVNLSAGSLAG